MSEIRSTAPPPPTTASSAPNRSGSRVAFSVAIAVAVLAVVVGVGQRNVGDPDQPEPQDVATDFLPPTTVMAPPGADPFVTCTPEDNVWFPYSALSGPVGAENDADPAAQALAASFLVPAGGAAEPSAQGWRRLRETDDLVLFGHGDLPLVITNRVERASDNTWRVGGSGGGYCDPWLQPPNGNSVARWSVDEDTQPDPQTTELEIFVGSGDPCTELSPDEIVGPDVIETTSSITIRLAIDRPPADVDDCIENRSSNNAIPLSIPLQQPLGHRQILDGNHYPAIPIRLPAIEPPHSPAVPVVSFPGGTEPREVTVVANSTGTCGVAGPDGCRLEGVAADVHFTAGSESVTGTTDANGRLTVIAPAGPIELENRSPDLWCPPTTWIPPEQRAASTPDPDDHMVGLSCTRLDLPHATITGTLTGADDRRILFDLHSPLDNRDVFASIEGDRFEVVLEPGPWVIQAGESNVFRPDCYPQSLIVTDGVEQAVNLTCTKP